MQLVGTTHSHDLRLDWPDVAICGNYDTRQARASGSSEPVGYICARAPVYLTHA